MAGVERDYLVELQNLGDCILKYTDIITKIADTAESARTAVECLYEIGWQGEAKDAFKSNFDTWINDTKAFKENMVQLENALKVMYERAAELKDEGGNLSSCL